MKETTFAYPSIVDILIVDDTLDNLRLLRSVLMQQGYRVRSAINGELALLAVQAEPPDLILLDINMPDMSGYEVCQILKEHTLTSQIPVIFLSVLDEPLDKVKAFAVGGADYITKPFHIEEVVARVNHQLMLRSLQQKLNSINENLEQQVQARTAELQLAYRFESSLKRIIEKVRDSLDEHQILQTAVQELTVTLGSERCLALVYDWDEAIATVKYEHSVHAPRWNGTVYHMAEDAALYAQLHQGQHFQFCPMQPLTHAARDAVLCCPVIDNERVLGELRLFNHAQTAFTDHDILLVQQVSTQCAIALRQSRLYQAVQSQVQELQQLNQLKDDFLSTVSHELRTPMSNIKMATEMLEITLEPMGLLSPTANVAGRYFKILKEECLRETKLINDLLDLSRLTAGTEPVFLNTLPFQGWVPHVAEVFTERIHQQQQSLNVEIPANLPPITTDFAHLERILTELLNNACKYTPPGESIAISAIAQHRDVILKISNSGSEIPPQHLTRIFEKFYRVPNSDRWQHEGTGLGLALVRRRVELLKGSISVKSDRHWTTFAVRLPVNASAN